MLSDETPQKRAVHVFEALAQGGQVRTRHYVDKETGIRLNLVLTRLSDDSVYSFTLTELEIDPEFPDDHFLFTPPADVELQDFTKQDG